MKPGPWLAPLVFLATAVPTVLLLHALDVGGDYRLMIGIAVGALATAIAQGLAAGRRGDRGPR